MVDSIYWPFLAARRAAEAGIMPLNAPTSAQVPQMTPRPIPPSRPTGPKKKKPLPPPSKQGGRLVSNTTDVLPSPAEATIVPNLTGQTGEVPFRQRERALCRDLTPATAVAPTEMGLDEPQRDGTGSAVSKMLAPDPGVSSAAAAVDRQLPSQSSARRVEVHQALATRTEAADTIAAGSGMVASTSDSAPKRRRIFR